MRVDSTDRHRQLCAAAAARCGSFKQQLPANLTMDDITDWLPLPDGIDAWFAKFDAGLALLGTIRGSTPFAYV